MLNHKQGQQGVGTGLCPRVLPVNHAGDQFSRIVFIPHGGTKVPLILQLTGWAAGDVMLVPMTELHTVAFPALQHSAPRRDGDKRHPAE